ncbi:MAG: DUF1080 domain-containing protein [Phycisphaerales bacterium]|nr:DUF1080 domain-containing protein [Phycisphaerales bacterium]
MLVLLAGCASTPPANGTPAIQAEEARPLLDGTTLEGWTGDVVGWTLRDGVLSCGPNGQAIYAPGEWSDFVLSFSFRLEPGANNGVAIRAPGTGDAAYEGMEIQVLDDGHEKYAGWLKDWQRHGSVYGLVASSGAREAMRPAGEWNDETITARGSRITVTLNGKTIVDADVAAALRAGPPSGKDHPGARRTSGKVGFLGHGDRVDFRNVRIRPLRPTT